MPITRPSVVRHGKVRWLCDPPHGVSVPNGDPNAGVTTAGELLAVAYSAFIATDLAERLERNHVPASELVVHAWCRLSSEATLRSVEEFEIKVQARVPGIDEERLRCVARVALASCHRSLGMRRNLRTKLHVSLAR
jgi:organic hydroperoxide reductase OsmC/OhrA